MSGPDPIDGEHGAGPPDQAAEDLAAEFDQARGDAERHGGYVWVPQEIDPNADQIRYEDLGPEYQWHPEPGWEERVSEIIAKNRLGRDPEPALRELYGDDWREVLD